MYSKLSDESDNVAVNDINEGKKKHNPILSALICFGVVFFWVSSAEVAISVEDDYDQPYFLTWMAVNMNIFLIPVWFLFIFFRHKLAPVQASLSTCLREDMQSINLTTKQLVLWTLPLGFLFTVSFYLYYISLRFVNPSVVIVSWNSAAIFVYLGSLAFLGERPNFLKAGGILLCILGLVLVALNKATNDPHDNPALGVGLNVLSAAMYAVMAIKLKLLVTDDAPLSVTHVLVGLLGVWNLGVLSVGLFILNATGYEVFRWATATDVIGNLSWLLLLTFGMNYSIVVGSCLTSPIFVSVASMAAIPVSIVVDYFVHSQPFTPLNVFGSILVCIGFLIVDVIPSPNIFYFHCKYLERR